MDWNDRVSKKQENILSQEDKKNISGSLKNIQKKKYWNYVLIVSIKYLGRDFWVFKTYNRNGQTTALLEKNIATVID